MRLQNIILLTLSFALIIAIFAVINVEAVRVNYLFGEADIPLILVILGSTLLGGLVVGFLGLWRQYRLQRKIKELQKQLQNLQAQSQEPKQEIEPLKAAEQHAHEAPRPTLQNEK